MLVAKTPEDIHCAVQCLPRFKLFCSRNTGLYSLIFGCQARLNGRELPDAALAAVVGNDPLPRTELTKKLWEYIRKHKLQDPKNKRNIRGDEKLLAVFDGKKVVSMFEMTKLVNGHLV